MNQPSIIAQLNAAWTADGYAHATPPTAGDIAAFESRYNVRLPLDFRLYIETVNGGALGRGSMTTRESVFGASMRSNPKQRNGATTACGSLGSRISF